MAPRKKTTPAVDTEVSSEVSETVAAEPASEKKSSARKTTSAKKATTAKKTETAAKKTASATKTKTSEKATKEPVAPVVEVPKVEIPVTEASAPKSEVFIEYGGAQVPVDEIINNAKKIVGNDKDIKIYVQPHTSKAYIAFGEETVAMDVFFC